MIVLEHQKLYGILGCKLHACHTGNKTHSENGKSYAEDIVEAKKDCKQWIVSHDYETFLQRLKRSVPWQAAHKREIERECKKKYHSEPEQHYGYHEADRIINRKIKRDHEENQKEKKHLYEKINYRVPHISSQPFLKGLKSIPLVIRPA